MPNVNTLKRWQNIQMRAVALLFVSCIVLAVELKNINIITMVACEVQVDRRSRFELLGSIVFSLTVFFLVTFPYLWPLFILEQVILMQNVYGAAALGVFKLVHAFLFDIYICIPMIVSLMGSARTMFFRYMFTIIWIMLIMR